MKLDIVDATPSHIGRMGRAWRLDWPAIMQRAIDDGHASPEEVARDCTVADWLIEAPYAHPAWHSYNLICTHLRDVGLVTKLYLEGATHEMWLYAMNPEVSRQEIITGEKIGGWLTPLNFAAQLICPSDEAAVRLMEIAALDVCAGTLCPDIDYAVHWRARFGDNMWRR